MILVALPALMLIASVGMLVAEGTIQSSISAYYKGPLRDVFVGMLVGLAACLVAYRGAPLEDYALNMAGFYAIFVAFVPLPSYIASLGPDEHAKTVAGIRLVVVSAILATALFLVWEWHTRRGVRELLSDRRPETWWVFGVFTALAAGYVVLLGYRVFEGGDFDGVHLTSAVLLIVSLTLAVATHAFPKLAGEPELKEPRRGWYLTITVLMSLGLIPVALLARWLWSGHLGLVVEWWEVTLFAVFWFRETTLNWNGPPERKAPGGNGGPR